MTSTTSSSWRPAWKSALRHAIVPWLCRFFGLSDGWWLRLQADYDTEVAKASLAKALAKIRPWKKSAEQTADAH